MAQVEDRAAYTGKIVVFVEGFLDLVGAIFCAAPFFGRNHKISTSCHGFYPSRPRDSGGLGFLQTAVNFFPQVASFRNNWARIPTWKWYVLLPQLQAWATAEPEELAKTFIEILKKLGTSFPDQMLWPITCWTQYQSQQEVSKEVLQGIQKSEIWKDALGILHTRRRNDC